MSWTYTNPDNGEKIEIYSTDDGDEAVWAPRHDNDPKPYVAEGTTGRRYGPGRVS